MREESVWGEGWQLMGVQCWGVLAENLSQEVHLFFASYFPGYYYAEFYLSF